MKTVAYLGPEHTNTHLAALDKFGPSAEYMHAPTVEDVFHAVERRKTDFGVVPIENSLEGAVTHTLDRFIDFQDSPARIQGEIQRTIEHALIVHPDADLTEIEGVFSHPQALAQCRRWIDKQLGVAVTRYETNSTAEAVELLVQRAAHAIEPRRRAAIARKELARDRKLKAIPITGLQENKTRFLIIGLGEAKKGRRNKTSILFSLKDRPGALYDALLPFKREKINLTKIESRPSKKKAWEYYFFIDLAAHESEPGLKRALAAVRRKSDAFEMLGSYPIT